MTDVLQDKVSDLHIVDHMGSDASVVRAARVSYAGDGGEWRGEKDAKLIRYMAEHGHGTPFEHTSITFHVACPLFVRGQWHRHRIGWSYNEVSRRYTKDDVKFHMPDTWRRQNTSGNKQGSHVSDDEFATMQKGFNDLYLKNMLDAEKLFNCLTELGVANEQARMVLPQSMYTRFYATCNLRSAVHFIKLRDDDHAQPEIRAYAQEMKRQLYLIYPVSMDAFFPPPPIVEPDPVTVWDKLKELVKVG